MRSQMRLKNSIKAGSIKINDLHPISHFVGMIMSPSGSKIHMSLPRKTRSAARKDAAAEIAVLLDDVDLPLHLI